VLTYNGAGFVFDLNSGDGGVLNNLGTFNAAGDGDILFWADGPSAVNNTGTFTRSGGGDTEINVPFNNGNAVNVTAGVLDLRDGSDTGPYTLSSGTTLRFSGGTRTLAAAATVTGPSATLEFAGASVTVNGAVNVAALQVHGGTAALNVNTSVPSFDMTGAGTLAGTGNLTVTSALTWSGGIMAAGAGKTVLAATGTGTLSGSSGKFLSRTFDNNGVLTYSGLSFFFNAANGDSGVLNNFATFNAAGDGDIAFWGDGASAVNNSGTLTRSGSGDTVISVPFNNGNAVNVTAGVLDLWDGSDTGPYTLSAGTTLRLSHGTRTLAAAATVTGPSATLEFAGASATLNGAVAVAALQVHGGTATLNVNTSVPSFDMTAGTLAGTGNLTVTSALTWSSGFMAAGAARTILAATGTGTLLGSSGKFLSRTFDNHGVLTYNGTGFLFDLNNGDSGVLNNLAGATFDLAGDGDIGPWADGPKAINSAGMFRKTAGMTTSIDIPFNLTGSVEVQSGTLNVNGGGSASGAFNLAGGLVTVTGGTFTLLNGAAGTGPGTLVVYGGTVAVNTGESASVARLTQRRGATVGGGTLTVTSSYSFGGGTQSGTGKTVVAATATGSMSGTAIKLLGRTLENHGTLTYSGSGLEFGFAGGTGVINNTNGAVFSLTGDGDMTVFGSGAHAIVNAGTLNRSGAGTTSIDSGISFTTTGAVNVTAGTLDVGEVYTQSAGITTLSAGTALASAGGVLINGGTLDGFGTVSGNLTNKGQVRPGGAGPAGTLTVTGNYTQTASGVLDINLGGTAPGQFDVLAVGGLATLDGTMNVSLVNGFHPSLGDAFKVLTFGSRSGIFSTINGLGLGGGLQLNPVYNPNDLTLVTQSS
jgi:hypothetical protein